MCPSGFRESLVAATVPRHRWLSLAETINQGDNCVLTSPRGRHPSPQMATARRMRLPGHSGSDDSARTISDVLGQSPLPELAPPQHLRNKTCLNSTAPMAVSQNVRSAPLKTDEEHIADLVRFTERTFSTGSPVPFGAMVVDSRTGERLLRTVNNARKENDATCHAEVRAIRLAGKRIKQPMLNGYTLFTTCEPCPMCMAAILWARLDRVVFGATIEDASRHCHQIHIKAGEVVAKSDMKCDVTGPISRELCYELFTAPAMLKTFEYWRRNRR